MGLLKTLIFCILFLAFCNTLLAQKNYAKNPHVKFVQKTQEGKYYLDYTFKDQWEQIQNFHFEFNIEQTNKKIKQFGIPESMFDPYISTSAVLKKRAKILNNGMFKSKGKMLVPDKSALIAFYREKYCKPIAEQIVETLVKAGKDTRNNRIGMSMKFVQDIPYGVPKNTRNDKYSGGILTPPEILTQYHYGDCDSKAVLFVGILSYLIDSYDMLFVGIPGHVLTAIRAEPVPGQTYYIMQDGDYIIAETAGPGRRDFGEKGEHYEGSAVVERIDLKQSSYQYMDPDSLMAQIEGKIDKSPKSKFAIRIENKAGKDLVFRISPNSRQWNRFSLKNGQSYDFDFENQSYGYFRISTNKKIVHYRVYSFREYYIAWNPDRNIFDLYYYKQ